MVGGRGEMEVQELGGRGEMEVHKLEFECLQKELQHAQ